MDYNNKYIINIFERYTDLKKSNKQEFDNNDLWKIFEYYSSPFQGFQSKIGSCFLQNNNIIILYFIIFLSIFTFPHWFYIYIIKTRFYFFDCFKIKF